MSNREFFTRISEWGDRVDGDLEKLAQRSIQRLAKQVVIDTPFDLGILRGNWQPSIGQPNLEGGSPDAGGRAIADIALKVLDLKPGETFYMVNNTAYARRLEHGFVGEDSLGRKYNQTGRHYVGNNVKRWALIVEQEAARLKEGK